jgi:hypothetical protein
VPSTFKVNPVVQWSELVALLLKLHLGQEEYNPAIDFIGISVIQ